MKTARCRSHWITERSWQRISLRFLTARHYCTMPFPEWTFLRRKPTVCGRDMTEAFLQKPMPTESLKHTITAGWAWHTEISIFTLLLQHFRNRYGKMPMNLENAHLIRSGQAAIIRL